MKFDRNNGYGKVRANIMKKLMKNQEIVKWQEYQDSYLEMY